MKKLYFFALAAAVSFSAGAATQLKLHTPLVSKNKTESHAVAKLSGAKSVALTSDGVRPAKAAAATEISGDYEITIGDYYFETSVGEFTEDCTISQSGDNLTFTCDYFPLDVNATYNESTGVITFTKTQLGLFNVGNAQYYILFQPTVYDWNLNGGKGGIDQLDSYTAVYDGATGTITLDADHGFGWAAYTDDGYTQLAGYLELFDVVGLEKIVEPENPNEGWTSLGKATLMDGWVLPAFGIDQTLEENWYKVELQQNDDDKNLYRLVDPYHGDSPVAEYNETAKVGYIQFDVTDPDHVVFVPVVAGFAYSEFQLTKLYCINTLTVFTEYLGSTVEETLITLENAGLDIPFTTFKDGVVTLPSTQTDGEWTNDTCFGIQGGPADGYTWEDTNGATANMAAKIIFPDNATTGIDNVTTCADNTPVKYFNLQGVEVAKPAAGSVVIRVQGEKATKILAK